MGPEKPQTIDELVEAIERLKFEHARSTEVFHKRMDEIAKRLQEHRDKDAKGLPLHESTPRN